jgi:hypothetical protein
VSESFTIIDSEVHSVDAKRAGGRVRIEHDALRAALGWELKPEGLCRGDVCVPVADRDALADADGVDLESFAAALGRPIAIDLDERAAALGTPVDERRAQLGTLEAPDFELPDLSGAMHRLSDHRGKKVLLIAYASW